MIKRSELNKLLHTLKRGKSILLFGPRQVGKTTLIRHIKHDLFINLMNPQTRQLYEREPETLISEVNYLSQKTPPIIIIDEVQKVPQIMDAIQVIIDDKLAQFIITGSSAKKIKNLLPGRVIRHTLTPITYTEFPFKNLEKTLTNGTLPEIINMENQSNIDQELNSYVSIYLEEEIRKEALVRNLGAFSKFLQLACLESGKLIHFRKLSQEIGIAHTTISEYFNILEDSMVVDRFDPITTSTTRKRLTKSSKYIIFDLGIRRIGALEDSISPKELPHLFEQWVGLELKRTAPTLTKIQFWRDHSGPEVDWVITTNNQYTPIEVKWTKTPSTKDAKHIKLFMKEYHCEKGYIICQTETPKLIAPNIIALPWQKLSEVFHSTTAS